MNTSIFIQEIKTINNIKIPSTPFNLNNDKTFIGDVLSCTITENTEVISTEYFMLWLRNGLYVGISNGNTNDIPMSELIMTTNGKSLKVLGNSILDPQLLNLMAND